MTRIGIILLRVEYTYTIWNSKMEYDLQRAKTSFFVTIAPTSSIREDKNKTNHSCMNRRTDIYIRSCTPRPHHFAHTCTLYYTHSHKSDLDHYYHFYYYNVRVLLLLLLLLLLNIGSENRSLVIFNEFASKYVNTTFST
ncbi:unnamed protein product [Aphis gossypii]|uniref:Uncharacterized protein n=1 Tax=Aphis gossypii TaxID=80765 RepID=A0A9P0J3S6_APHGO|nr:unnamed protein product [Aphis gossypii]